MTCFLQPFLSGQLSSSYPGYNTHLNIPFGLLRRNLLSRALHNLQNCSNSSQSMCIELPALDGVRMRNLVHRGAQRPVSKSTSVKLDRVVQCESVLEHEAFLLLEVSPFVQAFAEQPVRIRYRQGYEWRSHIPDFAMLIGGRITFIELKFYNDVDSEVSDRTRFMESMFKKFGVGYCLVTEKELRKGFHVQNAICVLRRARHSISEVQHLASLEKLRSVDQLPLSAFGWSLPGSKDAIGVAKLIMSGHAAIDDTILVSDRACVWLAEGVQPKGGAI